MGLANINIKFTADLKQFSTSMQNATRSIDKLGRKMKSAGAGMSKYITAPILGLGAAAIHSAAKIETLETSFTSLLGSEKAAKDMTEELLKFSASTPFQIEGIGKSAKQLLAAGVAASDVTKKLKTIGDVAAGANIPIEEMTQIFAKGMSKGKAQAEELNQMAERGIPILQELADMYGVTKAEIYDMASKGKIGFEAVNQALENMTTGSGVFSNQMLKQSNTIAGIISTLKDNISIVLGDIGSDIIKTFDVKTKLQGFISWLQDLRKWFNDLSPVTKKWIITLSGIAAAVGPLMMIAGTILPMMMSGFVALSGPIGLVLAGISAVVAVVIKYWPQIKKMVLDVANYFIDLYNESTAVRVGVELLKVVFKTVFDYIKFALKSVIAGFSAFGKILKGVLTFDTGKIKEGIADFGKSLKNGWKDVAGNLKENMNIAIANIQKKKIHLKAEVSEVTAAPSVSNIMNTGASAFNTTGGQKKNKQATSIGIGSIAPVSMEMRSIVPAAEEMNIGLEEAFAKTKEISVEWSNAVSNAVTDLANNVAVGFGEFIGGLMTGNASLADLGGVIMGQIAQLLKGLGEAAIKIGIGMIAIKKAFTNPFTAIAAGVALIAFSSVIKNMVSDSYEGVKTFADGGIVYGPTNALIGEYPGASSNPEVVAPLNKLQDIIGAGNSQQVIIESGQFVLEGDKLKLVMDRTVKRQNRTR